MLDHHRLMVHRRRMACHRQMLRGLLHRALRLRKLLNDDQCTIDGRQKRDRTDI